MAGPARRALDSNRGKPERERLSLDRLPLVADILRREAAAISRQVNPFDPVLRRPAASFSNL